MNKEEIKETLQALIPRMELDDSTDDSLLGPRLSIYLGSFMSLDPCGRYHHVISLNNLTDECEEFWENLDKVAEELGGWTESGEGDPTDIFFCMPAPAKEKKRKVRRA
jgi:hypothetical protein